MGVAVGIEVGVGGGTVGLGVGRGVGVAVGEGEPQAARMGRQIKSTAQEIEYFWFMGSPYEWQIGGANPSDCLPKRREEETCVKPDLC